MITTHALKKWTKWFNIHDWLCLIQRVFIESKERDEHLHREMGKRLEQAIQKWLIKKHTFPNVCFLKQQKPLMYTLPATEKSYLQGFTLQGWGYSPQALIIIFFKKGNILNVQEQGVRPSLVHPSRLKATQLRRRLIITYAGIGKPSVPGKPGQLVTLTARGGEKSKLQCLWKINKCIYHIGEKY